MYVILTKNGDNTWDGVHQVPINPTADTTIIDAALESGLPVVGMNASSHKASSVRGAVWNGDSFVGGNVNSEASVDQEQLDSFSRYVFLCDNKVVFSMTVKADSGNTEMFDAAFAGETILVKCEDGPFNKVGKTFNWDGTELTLALSE
jgi:hypothetical protein